MVVVNRTTCVAVAVIIVPVGAELARQAGARLMLGHRRRVRRGQTYEARAQALAPQSEFVLLLDRAVPELAEFNGLQ